MKRDISIIFTDLDGTLLNSQKELSNSNLQCLHDLKEAGIIRVISTGRSLYSFKSLFPEDVPADYLIFSTGAGIVDIDTEKLIHSTNLVKDEIQRVSRYLQGLEVDFMVHHAVPQNHYFTYFTNTQDNTDFVKRIEIYQNFATQFSNFASLPEHGAQIIAILPDNPQLFEEIEKGLNGLQITRTTSPFDGKSIWMEIMPNQTSKGTSAAWLCNHLGFEQSKTMGIGNDYNDISLLDFTWDSYLVANAPMELHDSYQLTSSNDDDGFFHAAGMVLND